MGISFKTGLVTGPALAVALFFGAVSTASAELADDLIFGSLGGSSNQTQDSSGKKVERSGRRHCVTGQSGSDVIIGNTGSSGGSSDRARRGGSGNDVLLGDRGIDRQRRSGRVGSDLIILNNGDGSDFSRGPRRNCGKGGLDILIGNTGDNRSRARSSTR